MLRISTSWDYYNDFVICSENHYYQIHFHHHSTLYPEDISWNYSRRDWNSKDLAWQPPADIISTTPITKFSAISYHKDTFTYGSLSPFCLYHYFNWIGIILFLAHLFVLATQSSLNKPFPNCLYFLFLLA